MSTTTINLNLHLKRIQKSLAFALAAQDPDDPQLQASFRKEVEAGVACLHGCVARNESVHPTLLMLSAVAESADAQKSGRTIDFKSIREEDGRIAEGWRAAATAETPADVGDLGENRWWEGAGVAMAGTGATVAGAGAAKRPREVDGGEADASAALAKRTRAAAVSHSRPPARNRGHLVTEHPSQQSENAFPTTTTDDTIVSPIICLRCAETHAACYVNPTTDLICVVCKLTRRACSLMPKKQSADGPPKNLRGPLGHQELGAELQRAQSLINTGAIPHPQADVPLSQVRSAKSFSG
ncbi:hypothetical protein A0H81_02848 [Grifola frondosa]|uniref:Uncharacterized protein n=1 Tax=Grifola frondosa TaxID=5627 RepID=A0A1C7MLF1_GRIFR|nr:hypothetical protein A0H81_02848 [Grifola frondosa]